MAEDIITVQRVGEAWQALFAGHGSREDALIVLRDLMTQTGFYAVTAAEVPPDQVKFSEGQRSVYGYLLDRIEMNAEALSVERDARFLRPVNVQPKGQLE